MTPEQQEYRDLLSLTQSYILAEYKGKHRVITDPNTYAFFKQYQPKQQQKPQPPIQQQQIRPQNVPPPIQIKPQPPPTPPQPKQQVEAPPQQKPSTPVQNTTQPSAAPKQVEPKVQENSSTRFKLKLEPVDEVNEVDLASVKREIEKLFPHIQILTDTPDDAQAKKVGQQWKQSTTVPEVVILAFYETPDQQVFLQNVAAAISQRLASCVIYSAPAIEKKKAWNRLLEMKNLRLIITTDYGMYSLQGLMQYYRESPEKAQRYLGGIPLLLLTDIALYLKQPSLKPALWQALCTMLPKGKK